MKKVALLLFCVTFSFGAQFIKGSVRSIEFSGGAYIYEIYSNDTQNLKLPYAKVLHVDKIFSLGDLVYAKVKDEKLLEFYILQSDKIITQKPTVSPKIRPREKSNIILDVATSEDIFLH